MTLNLMPITGIPLPFFSYGGSFMLACWLSVGILARISSEGPRRHDRAVEGVSRAAATALASRLPVPYPNSAQWLGGRKDKKPRQPRRERLEIPADVWEKCEACGHTDIREKFERNLNVCPNCDYHRRIRASDYCTLLLDEGTMEEVEVDLRSTDPLGFPEYPARLKKAIDERRRDRRAAGRAPARSTSLPVNLGVMDFAFMGGSMGSVVGEKIARLGQRSLERKYPLIIVSASGGARMQEGVLSLMQMAKVSAVLAQLAERRIPYVSILTNPTTGGVSASYAMLGDAILAEPGAVIGFAGPRVIKQTLGQDLPEGFQTAEFLLDHGMLDSVVAPPESQAHGEPAAAPHVRPPGGDGVDVALTVRAVTANALADYRDALDYLFARTTGGVQVRPRAHARAARRSWAIRSARIRRSTSRARTAREAASRRWRRCCARRACASRRTRRRTSSISASASSSTARRSRRATSSSSSHATLPPIERDRRQLLRGDDGDGVRLFRPRAASTSRSSRPASAAGSTRRTCITPLVAGVTSIGLDHTEYLGRHARGDRRREGRHLQARACRR